MPMFETINYTALTSQPLSSAQTYLPSTSASSSSNDFASLVTSLSTFTTPPLTSYLPSLTFAIFLSTPATTPSSLNELGSNHLAHRSVQPQVTFTPNAVPSMVANATTPLLPSALVSSLVSLTSHTTKTMHNDEANVFATAAASTALFNQSADSESGSVLQNIDAYLLYLSLNRNILVALLLGTIMIFTIVGNLMVIWAIFNYRPLHNVQNMFLVSLAVADIAVAVLVMPFNVAYNLLDKWIFGLHLCEMWLTSDVLCCTASILNLCAIALDRYYAIHDPINYAQKRTMRRVCTSIAIVWVLSAIISIPPLIGWNDWPEEFNEETPCKLSEEKSYLIYSSSGSFYIPLLIMTVVYFKIFQATRRRLKDRAKASAMANLGRCVSKTTATTVSTTAINLTKLSSNDDSSSSSSPKMSTSFMHIKARCVRCCCNQTQTNDRSNLSRNAKHKNGRFKRKVNNSYLAKEARIEIESASEDLDHSRNDLSSSEIYGVTSAAIATTYHDTHISYSYGVQSSVGLHRPPCDSFVSANGVQQVTSHVSCPVNGDQVNCAIESPKMNQVNVVESHTTVSTLCCSQQCPPPYCTDHSSHAMESAPIHFVFDSASTVNLDRRLDCACANRNDILAPNDTNNNSSNSPQRTYKIFNLDTPVSLASAPCDANVSHTATNGNSNDVAIRTPKDDSIAPCSRQVDQIGDQPKETVEHGAAKQHFASLNPSSSHHPNCCVSSSLESNASSMMATSAVSQNASPTKVVRLTAKPVPVQPQVSVKKIWEEKQKISLSRERRATRILGIVMGVFVACWLPFFLMYVIMPFCESCYLSREVESFITWLGYINSALNPLIYCGFNRDFRRAFQKILSCKKV